MQAYTEDYRTSMDMPIRNTNTIEVLLELENVLFNDECTIIDNNNLTNISDVANINKPNLYNITKRYSMCELNYSELNNDLDILPNDLEADLSWQGYVSNDLSGADCTFTSNPKITITGDITKEYDIYGVALKFDVLTGIIPSDFTIKGYDDTTLIKTITVTDNTLNEYLSENLDNVNKLEIEITKMRAPNTRFRLESIYFGIKKKYNEDDIIDTEQSWYIHPMSKEMSLNKFEFAVNNLDHEYDTENPTGISQYFMQRQRLKITYGYYIDETTIENIEGGILYLDAQPNINKIQANFVAYGLYYFMNKKYTKGIYNVSGESYGDLLEDIFEFCELPTDSSGNALYVIDSSLYSINCKMPLPYMKCNELVQLICNATNMIVYEDRDGHINIQPNDTVVNDYAITENDTFEQPIVEYTPKVNKVNVKVYSLKPEASSSELYNGTTKVTGTQTVFFEYSLSHAQTATVTGGTLVSAQYYAYGCDLEITASGDVTVVINGYKIKEQSNIVTYDTGSTDGEDCEIDNELVGDSDLALTLAQNMATYLQNRKSYEIKYRGDVVIDANDKISLDNQFTEDIPIRIMEHNIVYNGTITGTIKAKGI